MTKHRHLLIECFLLLVFLAGSSAAILALPKFAQLENASYTQFGLFFIVILASIVFFYSLTLQFSANLSKQITKLKTANSKIRKNARVQDRIITLTHELMDIQNTDNAFDKILEYAIGSIDHAVVGSIMLLGADNKMTFAASKGFDHEELKNINLHLEDTFLWVKTNGNITGPVIVNDSQAFNKSVLSPELFEAFEKVNVTTFETTLSAPLFVGGKLYGMLNVDSTRKNAFGAESLRLMEYFTTQAEFAIKNRDMMEHIYDLSRFDSLTKIFNRRYFMDLMELDIQKSSRYDISFLLVLFDLDGLKKINDTYGHLAGDRCLFHFANELKGLVRKQDIIGRYGGDEFIASFYKCDWKDLTVRIEEFREHFRNNPCIYNDTEIPISFSYGLAEFPSDGRTYSALVHKADTLMYASKREFRKMKAFSEEGFQESI